MAIQDTFIRTSVRQHSLEVDYSVVNHSQQSRQVVIEAEAIPAHGGPDGCRLRSESIVLSAGETKRIPLRAA